MIQPIKPMLLDRIQLPFDNEGYIFEPKLDGWRVIAYLAGDKTVLYSRRGSDISDTFVKLAHLHTCADKPCILDGEIVADDGFWSVRKGVGISYIPFDILEIDGENVTDMPLIERKKLLRQNLFSNLYSPVPIPYIEAEGRKFFDLAVSKNLEGIIAKRKKGKYYAGKRTAEWVKIKNSKYIRECK